MKSLITTITCILLSILGFGQNSDFTKLDTYFQTLEKHDRFFGSVAISHAGKIIYTQAIGYADLETQLPNTAETKFRIGSTTKTFTAALVMKAVEKGKLSLDDPIKRYFPEIQNSHKITIRHLLNHRSGINNFTDRSYFSWYTKPISQAALLDTIESKGIGFDPDEKYAYSNSNYVLLTFMLEDIFGKSYEEILKKYILKPLGLKNTKYGGKTDITRNEARSYRMKSDWTLATEGDMSIPLGAGGIISTPTDLCLFTAGLFNGKIISPESLEQMKPIGEDSYGFGLEEVQLDGMTGWGHPGVIDAFSSTVAYFAEQDLSIALLCNGSNYGSHDVAIATLREVLDKPYELPSFDVIELTPEELDQYVGTYESEKIPMDFTIRKKGNTLELEAPGQGASTLTAEGNHVFSIMKYGVKITFYPEEKRMHFVQQGMEFDFTLKSSGEPIPEPVIVANVDLDQYLGTYTSDQLPMDLTISKEGNTLTGQGTGQPSFPLVAQGDHTFVNQEIGLTFTFMPSENKLIFEQGGASFEMSRN